MKFEISQYSDLQYYTVIAFLCRIYILQTFTRIVLLTNYLSDLSFIIPIKIGLFTNFLKKSGCFEVPLLSIYERIRNKITETENKLSKINSKLDGSIIEMEDGKRYKLVLMED